MTCFFSSSSSFVVVGLEARREFDLGELRERRRFALPLLVRIGGMAVAVAISLPRSDVRAARQAPPS
jgi:Na+/H+ antiporter NhaA